MKKAVVILVVLLIASIVANLCFYIRDGPQKAIVYTECHIDTIPYFLPVPVDSVVLRYETVTLPIANPTDGIEQTLVSETTLDSTLIENNDSVAVQIPITQKVYEDSTFRAYVSGYHPALDSIEIYKRTETIYIRSPTKPKRWGLGFQLGIGMTPTKVEPYIGVGISYNILSF